MIGVFYANHQAPRVRGNGGGGKKNFQVRMYVGLLSYRDHSRIPKGRGENPVGIDR